MSLVTQCIVRIKIVCKLPGKHDKTITLCSNKAFSGPMSSVQLVCAVKSKSFAKNTNLLMDTGCASSHLDSAKWSIPATVSARLNESSSKKRIREAPD